uniref:Alpha-carbonic anhydrase domain-containing protein n=1 Tax=Varanus komodoensis TaxID=61221 RepID=A0A8D2LFI7_VARKO
MELHLIHWNSTMYHSINEAVGKKNGITIIALFVQIGKEHSGLKAVTEILQDIQYKVKHYSREEEIIWCQFKLIQKERWNVCAYYCSKAHPPHSTICMLSVL